MKTREGFGGIKASFRRTRALTSNLHTNASCFFNKGEENHPSAPGFVFPPYFKQPKASSSFPSPSSHLRTSPGLEVWSQPWPCPWLTE